MFTAASSYSEPSQRAEATANTMNIIPYYDISTTTQYGVPGMFLTRFPHVATRVSGLYMGLASIHLNFSSFNQNGSTVVTTNMGTCITSKTNYDGRCTHFSNCNNSHHTNYVILANQVLVNYSFNSSNYVALYLSCGRFCYNYSTGHSEIRGHAFPSSNLILVQDYDFSIDEDDYHYVIPRDVYITDLEHTDYVSGTLAHEIGHLYGATHHYNGTGEEYCLWGDKRHDPEVVYHLTVCSPCQQTIYSNRGNYNHS